MNVEFANRLHNLGYFKGLDPQETIVVRDEILTRGWSGIFSNSYRVYSADAEELAEGGIGEFIARVAPFLIAEGVTIPEIEEDSSADGYLVWVGNERNVIYEAADLERDGTGAAAGLVWGLSMARGFRLVSALLADAGSEETVYAVNGGNDLFAFFLTPALHRLIIEHPDASPLDAPYSPTEQFPFFGQPQR
jgi:hypothetical protein